MRKFLLLLCFMLIIVVFANARTLEITKLNTSTIKIGEKNCQVGSTFSDESIIYWSSPKQVMWVKYIDGTDREKKCLTREAFANRKVKTPIEYFNKINHPSVRSDEMELIEGKNKSLFPDKRIALVIGNSNYEFQSTLSNPINDASDVSEKLVSLGFDVYLIHDVSYSDFDIALKKLCGRAKNRNYDAAIIYFCGHGIQYQGQSYLVPIDALLDTPEDLFNCIDMQDIYNKMGRNNCSTNLIFIDACRNEREWNQNEDVTSENDPQNVGVLFSSAPNSIALDGESRNSPFANAFIQSIDEPSSDFFSTINKISRTVKSETNQEPHYVGKTSFPFTFLHISTAQNIENTKTVSDVQDIKSNIKNSINVIQNTFNPGALEKDSLISHLESNALELVALWKSIDAINSYQSYVNDNLADLKAVLTQEFAREKRLDQLFENIIVTCVQITQSELNQGVDYSNSILSYSRLSDIKDFYAERCSIVEAQRGKCHNYTSEALKLKEGGKDFKPTLLKAMGELDKLKDIPEYYRFFQVLFDFILETNNLYISRYM